MADPALACYAPRRVEVPASVRALTRRMVKKVLRHQRTLALAARLIAAWLRLVHATTRWRIEGREHAIAVWSSGRPAIGAFWHDQVPMMAFLWTHRRAGEPGPGPMRCVVLVSRHRDGRLIGDIAGRLGIGATYGSSSKGALEGFRELMRLLDAGHTVAITPDGPRGPRRVAQPGVARLALLSGRPVTPLGIAVSRRRVLRTWDRMAIPLPFGRGGMVYGEPILPREGDDEASLLARIAEGMDRAAARAEALASGAG